MRHLIRAVFVFVVVLSLVPLAGAIPPPPEGECGSWGTDGGSLVCGASCKYFSSGPSCYNDGHNPSPGYCWKVYFVEDPTEQTCHQGSYDPCCDTPSLF